MALAGDLYQCKNLRSDNAASSPVRTFTSTAAHKPSKSYSIDEVEGVMVEQCGAQPCNIGCNRRLFNKYLLPKNVVLWH